ncbi:MAG: hypothetical protein WCG25_00985 [bacterium]
MAIPTISCQESTGAYSFSRNSASGAHTLNDCIVPTLPNTAALTSFFHHQASPNHFGGSN